jgi:NAD(P)-dependent dehydrogenase (short-subunit alcohol dehydrogenase family)
VIRADLNNRWELAEVETRLRENPSITVLINNAGTAAVAPLLNADVQKMEEIISLNVTALTRLTYAAAPALVKRGAGTIINIASIVGISAETQVTIPPLQNEEEWTRFKAARRALSQRFGNSVPAPRCKAVGHNARA